MDFLDNIINPAYNKINDKEILKSDPDKKIFNKSECFKIYHMIKANNVSMDEVAKMYNVSKIEIYNLIKMTGSYSFLTKPRNILSGKKAKEVKVNINNTFKYFKNNSVEYHDYLLYEVGCDPLKGGPDGLWQKPWNPVSDEEYKKLEKLQKDLDDQYAELYL